MIIATPNFTHKPITLAAAKHGKHVMCEKPLGLNAGEVRAMYHACRDAGVVHMTAFTYRFAPSMRYLRHLVKSGALGELRHFRSQRFLDWPETSWGWRQYKDKAGAGDLFDMTIHRIDFAIDLMGPLKALCGATARFAPRTKTTDGKDCPPSEVDDWSSLIGEFASGATGVWEGTTLAKGYGFKGFGHEWAEINGSEGSAVYRLHMPNQIMLGKTGQDLAAGRCAGRVPQAGRQPARSQRRASRPRCSATIWCGSSSARSAKAATPCPASTTACEPKSSPTPCCSRTPSGGGSIFPTSRNSYCESSIVVRNLLGLRSLAALPRVARFSPPIPTSPPAS